MSALTQAPGPTSQASKPPAPILSQPDGKAPKEAGSAAQAAAPTTPQAAPETRVEGTLMGRVIYVISYGLECFLTIFTTVLEQLLNLFETLKEAVQTTPEPVVIPAQNPPGGPLATRHFGIRNGGGACYMSSVIQALLAIPSLSNLVAPEAGNGQNVSTAFDSICDILTGKNHPAPRTVTREEINQFRTVMIDNGFKLAAEPSRRNAPVRKSAQQDAAQFLEFLLEHRGFHNFHYRVEVLHEAQFPVPALDRKKVATNYIPLSIAHIDPNTDVQKLMTHKHINEELDPKAILSKFSPVSATLSPDCRAKVQGVAEVLAARKEKTGIIPTLQTICLDVETLPPFLPIALNRFANGVKLTSPIKPSPSIRAALIDEPNKVAVYDLQSMVVHSGNSINGGHFYTYVPKQIDGKEAWIEFNDETVSLHFDPQNKQKPGHGMTIHADACRNAYIYFYQFRGIEGA